LKGILGLGAYAILLNSTNQTQRATVYMNQAQNHGRNLKTLFFSLLLYVAFFIKIKSKLLVKSRT